MRFIARFDDICPGMHWRNFQRFESFFSTESRIKPLLGVVPDNRDPKLAVQAEREDFWDLMRHWRDLGWTLAQHGYTHEYALNDGGMLKVGSKSEFAGLPYADQHKKLAEGQRILQAQGIWQPYFMAPSHSFDRETLRALKCLGFTAITDGYGVYPYELEGLMAVPQLFATPRHFGFGMYTLCLHVNTMSERQIDTTLRFMQANAARFISFPDALSLRRDDTLARGIRLLSQGVLRSTRLLRGIGKA
jgi:predicted deacetylase